MTAKYNADLRELLADALEPLDPQGARERADILIALTRSLETYDDLELAGRVLRKGVKLVVAGLSATSERDPA